MTHDEYLWWHGKGGGLALAGAGAEPRVPRVLHYSDCNGKRAPLQSL